MLWHQLRSLCAPMALCLFLAFGSPTVAQYEGLQESAEYGERVTTITKGFMEIINRSMDWDDLAYGVLEGHVSDEYAQRKSRQLSIELRAAYRRLSDELRALPEPPAFAADPKIPARLRNLRSMARGAEDMAYSLIRSGEDLVEAAIAGAPGVFAELKTRGMEVLLGQLKQQLGMIDVAIAIEEEGRWVHHQYSAIKASTRMMTLFLQAAIEAAKAGDFQAINAIQPQVKALYEQGLIHIEDGRKNAVQQYRTVAAQLSETDFEQRLKKILAGIFADNVPEAFDIEERYLIEIFEFVSNIEMLNDDDIQDFMSKIALLEGERARLTLERQHKIAVME